MIKKVVSYTVQKSKKKLYLFLNYENIIINIVYLDKNIKSNKPNNII